MFVKLINPVFDTLEHLALMTVNNNNSGKFLKNLC